MVGGNKWERVEGGKHAGFVFGAGEKWRRAEIPPALHVERRRDHRGVENHHSLLNNL